MTVTVSEITAPRKRMGGPIGALLGLFSSIWLGVTLLALLFVYSAIGSAGAPIGPGVLKPPFILRPDAWVSVREAWEITEFEWFHLWPFKLLIGLICLNLVVVTVRRIPFNLVNLGVWMIHGGIITLALGSVWYFSAKVEGDAPVARREIVARLPGQEPVRFVASPGNRARVGSGDRAYQLQVFSITPDWELLSGEDKGDRAYKVSVMVQSPTQTYVRELLAGYPQYTEDLLRSDDSKQPFVRAKKKLGEPIVDPALDLSLDYAVQDYFYLMESAAVYVREAGRTEWIERPIRRLPRFRDHVSSYDRVWTAPGEDLPPLRPLDVAVPPASENDPLAGVTFRISDYLAYAMMRTERVRGGDRLDPAATVRLSDERGQSQEYDLAAFDAAKRSAGNGALSMHWAADEGELDAFREARPPVLHVTLVDEGIELDAAITTASTQAFMPIEGSEYAYRVRSFQDGLIIDQRTVSVAIVEIRKGDRTFVRWVFDDPSLTRDLPAGGSLTEHAEQTSLDPDILMTYVPGRAQGLRLVAGPGEDDLRLFYPAGFADDVAAGETIERRLGLNEPVDIGRGITLAVTQYAARSLEETRPLIVPPRQRDRDVGVQASWIRIHLPLGGATESLWLPYHLYAFDRPEDVLSRFPYRPSVVHLPDGRHLEILFSRRRMKLPAPVALEDFRMTTQIGGFSGTNLSVKDWTSMVRFREGDGWTAPTAVSVNDPQENGGYWYFQAQWDPPAQGSAGLNYTVLGVGNREGVLVQLAGCCIAVFGMIWAFYVKPTIRRRRQEAAYALAAAGTTGARRERGLVRADLEPVGAGPTAPDGREEQR